jgi:hypothetical protein
MKKGSRNYFTEQPMPSPGPTSCQGCGCHKYENYDIYEHTDSAPAVASPVAPKLQVTVDTKGRMRTSKEQRRAVLEEFERSGVSAARFAKRSGLKYSTLAGWLQRYRRTKPLQRGRPLRLLEAMVDSSPDAANGTLCWCCNCPAG